MEPDMRKVTFLPRPILWNFLEAAFSIALNTVNQILDRASGTILIHLKTTKLILLDSPLQENFKHKRPNSHQANIA